SSGSGTTVTVGSDYDQAFTLIAQACNAAGCGPWSSGVTIRTDPRPVPPTIWVTRGPQRNTQPGYGNCTGHMCTVFRVNANSTFPSGTYSFTCQSSGGQIGSYTWTERLN